MKTKNMFRGLLYAGLTALQLSCSSTKSTSYDSNAFSNSDLIHRGSHHHLTSIKSIPEKNENLKVAVKVKRLETKVFPGGNEDVLYEDNCPNETKAVLQITYNLAGLTVKPLNGGYFVNLDNCTLDFIIENAKKSNYILTKAISEDKSIRTENPSDGEELIMRLNLDFGDVPFFGNRREPREPSGKKISWLAKQMYETDLSKYKNYEVLKEGYQENQRVISVYGKPTKTLVAQRINKTKQEEKKKMQALMDEGYRQREQMRQENEKIEQKRRKEESRRKNLEWLMENQLLRIQVYVRDKDSRNYLSGAKIEIESDAMSQQQLLTNYPSLEEIKDLVPSYVNSNNEGYCKFSGENNPCTFIILKDAKNILKVTPPGLGHIYKEWQIKLEEGKHKIYVDLPIKKVDVNLNLFGGDEGSIEIK
ncbi:MAG: hypothetical protein AABW56_01420 [Nanoarchaeota archaeon]